MQTIVDRLAHYLVVAEVRDLLFVKKVGVALIGLVGPREGVLTATTRCTGAAVVVGDRVLPLSAV